MSVLRAIASLCRAAPAMLLIPFLFAAKAEELRPLCPDRPGKGTSPCTLDAGHFQVEIDAYDGSFQRAGGVTTDFTIAASPTLKYGVADTLDIEAGIAAYEALRVHDAASDTTLSGHGDLTLRGKWNFLGTDGKLTAVVEPFVKLATASRGLGNGALEGGMVLPLAYDLGGGWQLATTPEADILQDSGGGRHLALLDVIGIGRALEDGFNLGAELWTAQDFDSAGTTSQYSFDLDLAWQPPGDSDLQLDGGINFGLNRNTPGAQVYTGLSRRF